MLGGFREEAVLFFEGVNNTWHKDQQKVQIYVEIRDVDLFILQIAGLDT